MTVLTEAPANLPYFQWQENDSSDRNTSKLALFSNCKIMTVLTETPAYLPYFQCQDNDCSNRSTSKLALFLMAR